MGQGKPPTPLRDWEAFVTRQVQEQTGRHSYPYSRKIDFPAFDLSETGDLQELTQAATILQLQAQMENGGLNSESLTRFYLARIQRYNGQLRAYLELNPQALAEAQKLDAERYRGKLRGPLHGIPICIKDNIAVAGLHNTAGAAALQDEVAQQDAFIVQKLREAGAIILGKNNLSEWANFMNSSSVNGFSALGGHTRNPYGPFDVGGSSSGTAAAIAANLAVAGIGSETSGSLIYPAAQNSVFTLKPSLGLVSRDRIIPITDAQDTAGPLCKNAEDLAVIMQVIAAHDPSDSLSQAKSLQWSAPQTRPVRVGYIRHSQREGDLAAMDQVANALKSMGTEVLEVPLPVHSVDMLPVLRYGLREGVNGYLKTVQAQVSDLSAVIRYNRAHPEAAPYGQDLLIASQDEPLSAQEYRALVEHNRQTATLLLDELMAAHKLQVILVVSNTLSALTSTSGVPVVNFPAGYRESGEPVGASLVGTAFEDACLIALAEQIAQRMLVQRPPKL